MQNITLDVSDNNENIEHKYRPLSVKNMILRDGIKVPILQRLEDGVFGNMAFFGYKAGTGKTTIAKAICNDLGLIEGKDFMFANGSQANVKFINEDIPEFLNKASGRKKFVILDEFDNKALHNAQSSFRHIIDTYSNMATFIFTGNDITSVNEAIKSRCKGGLYNFDDKGTIEEQKEITKQMTIRLYQICENEGVEIPKKYGKEIAEFVFANLPSLRDILHTFFMVLYENKKVIDDRFIKLLSHYSTTSDEVIKIIKSKNLSDIRKYSIENGNNISGVIDAISKFTHNNFGMGEISTIAMVMGEWDWKIGVSANKEHGLYCMLIDLVGSTGKWDDVDIKDVNNLGV